MAVSAVAAAKRALRRQGFETLAAITPEDRAQQSALVTQRLLATAAYKEAHTVSVFLSTTTEIDTDGIVQAVLAAGKRLFVPLLTDGRMEMVAVHDAEDIAAFPTNRWNIREPPLEPPRERAYDKGGLDLIVMPGMFFDKSGRRLGYGKGYYDRFIKQCRATATKKGLAPPKLIAVALTQQVISQVPTEPHDEVVDALVTADFTSV